jgi:hypothetical protein
MTTIQVHGALRRLIKYEYGSLPLPVLMADLDATEKELIPHIRTLENLRYVKIDLPVISLTPTGWWANIEEANRYPENC